MISIILPTYQEKENIISFIQELKNTLSGEKKEILVIDDQSPDGTYEKVISNFKDDLEIKAYKRKEAKGLTASIMDGIKASKGNTIIWMDSDFEHPPHILPKLIAEIEKGSDVCIASRFKEKKRIPAKSFLRKLQITLTSLLSLVCQKTFSNKITDWTSGFICIRKEVMNLYPLRGDYGESFIPLLNDLLNADIKIEEIPYTPGLRESGSSKTAPSLYGFLKMGVKYLKVVMKEVSKKKSQ